jgi:AcrR family transcriptional regulator
MSRSREAKQRLDEAAYELFSKKGIRAVGINEVIARSGVARMTLYRNYKSKSDLIAAFLDLRERRWTFEWLVAETTARQKTPRGYLLVIFDLFEEWFRENDFRGCPIINTLLESELEGPTHQAAVAKLTNVRKILEEWAIKGNLANAKNFARIWQNLMHGSIISARAGDVNAAREAKKIGTFILKRWPLRKPKK